MLKLRNPELGKMNPSIGCMTKVSIVNWIALQVCDIGSCTSFLHIIASVEIDIDDVFVCLKERLFVSEFVDDEPCQRSKQMPKYVSGTGNFKAVGPICII